MPSASQRDPGASPVSYTHLDVYKRQVLSLHSVTQETWPIINGSKDVWSAVSWKDYYDSYRLISALLVYLDQNLP